MLRVTRMLLIVFFLIMQLHCTNKPNKEDTVVNTSIKDDPSSTSGAENQDKPIVLFFGDSLTAGYGLQEEDAFPTLVQNRIDSLGMGYQVVNGGLSGDTSSNGKSRISWVLRNPVDVFVLALGANDMLRGLDLNSTEENLRGILEAVQAKNKDTKIIIAGMIAPPNMGERYVDGFKGMYKRIADEYSAGYIPFLLEGVAGDASLNLGDGKHPNAIGQKIVMENVWEVLESYL